MSVKECLDQVGLWARRRDRLVYVNGCGKIQSTVGGIIPWAWSPRLYKGRERQLSTRGMHDSFLSLLLTVGVIGALGSQQR